MLFKVIFSRLVGLVLCSWLNNVFNSSVLVSGKFNGMLGSFKLEVVSFILKLGKLIIYWSKSLIEFICVLLLWLFKEFL